MKFSNELCVSLFGCDRLLILRRRDSIKSGLLADNSPAIR